MKVEKIYRRGSFASNMYLVYDGEIGLIIDPSHDYSTIAPQIEESGIRITHCFLTHAHFDHFLAIDSILEHTDARVFVGKEDGIALRDSRLNCYYQFLGADKAYQGDFLTLSEGDNFYKKNLIQQKHLCQH